jgi:hypothetical protein
MWEVWNCCPLSSLPPHLLWACHTYNVQLPIHFLPHDLASGLEGSFGHTDSGEATGQRFKFFSKKIKGVATRPGGKSVCLGGTRGFYPGITKAVKWAE